MRAIRFVFDAGPKLQHGEDLHMRHENCTVLIGASVLAGDDLSTEKTATVQSRLDS
jgi:hypothetical protein